MTAMFVWRDADGTLQSTPLGTSSQGTYRDAAVGDFNGDGIDDIAILYTNGTGFAWVERLIMRESAPPVMFRADVHAFATGGAHGGGHLAVADFVGDDADDIAFDSDDGDVLVFDGAHPDGGTPSRRR
jgi:hypothetical protein